MAQKKSPNPLQAALAEGQKNNVTHAEIVKRAGVSTKTLTLVKSGAFAAEIVKEALENQIPTDRRFRGAIVSITRLADFFHLDPVEVAVSYGFAKGTALDSAIAMARAKAKPAARSPDDYSLHEILKTVPRSNLDVTVVGSPKGGVGRTLYLVQAALIQAHGCSWAGIKPEFPLLWDFDFDAPGIHNYPIRETSNWSGDGAENDWYYRTLIERRLSHQGMDSHLEHQPVGLVFLLRALTETAMFHDCAKTLLKGTHSPNYEPAVESMRSFLVAEIADTASPTCLLRHLVALVDHCDEPKLAFFPAGSPKNREYGEVAMELNWPEQLASGMGIVVLIALLDAVALISPKNATGLLGPIKRVWIDQGPGYSSLPAKVHEMFSTRQVLVSSLAPQSTDVLLAQVKALKESEREHAWVNLTFYRGRSLGFSHQARGGDTFSYVAINDAERHFMEADDERKKVVDSLTKLRIPAERISIADFDPNLMNRQTLRSRDSSYFDCVARSLAAMECARNPISVRAKSEPSPTRELLILGEYCGNSESKTENCLPGGVLRSLEKWLKLKLPDVTVRGIAASHGDIVDIADGMKKTLWFEDYRSSSQEPLLKHGFSSRQDNSESKQFRLSDFDIAALPAYACDDQQELLTYFNVSQLNQCEVNSLDFCGELNGDYLRKNIRGWKEWSICAGREDEICGVPLFSHSPLIVSNKEIFDSQQFKEAFRLRAHKVYSSMLSFADIRNSAIVSVQAGMKECSLMMTTEPVSRVYEWLLVLGIAGCDPFLGENPRRSELVELLSTDQVFASTLDYALLDYLASFNRPSLNDWNAAMTAIFRKNAGFMFVWPDAILEAYKRYSEFAYAPVPAGLQLSETWLLTVPRPNDGAADRAWLWKQLIQLMSYEEQLAFCNCGGIPVHVRAAADLEIWRANAFMRILGLTRQAGYDSNFISIPRRAFDKQSVTCLGESLDKFCKRYAALVAKKKQVKDGDWQAALNITQNPFRDEAIELRKHWEQFIQPIARVKGHST